MKKNGFTIVEIIISVGLISIVMLLLFQLLTDMEYENDHSSFAKANQVNRATVIRTIQSDLMNYTLTSRPTITSPSNSKEIDLQFDTFNRTIIVFTDRISYNGEVWLLESGNDEAYFDLDRISVTESSDTCSPILNVDTNGDGKCDYNCDTNGNGILDGNAETNTRSDTYQSCPSYKSYKIVVPVINNDDRDNSIDDIELFYIGNKV